MSKILNFFRSTPVVDINLTAEDKMAEGAALASYALDVFDSAVRDLEIAAHLHDEAAEEIQAELDELTDLLTDAIYESDRASAAARKIRGLVA